jgi:hypothetical protein
VVDQQTLGDGGEQCAGLAGVLQIAASEQAHEGVLAEVFGSLGAVQAFAQPSEQPGLVVAVEQADKLQMG